MKMVYILLTSVGQGKKTTQISNLHNSSRKGGKWLQQNTEIIKISVSIADQIS